MGVFGFGASLAISLPLIINARQTGMYTFIQKVSLNDMRRPTNMDLVEGLIDQSMEGVYSEDYTLFRNSFCPFVEECFDLELLSNRSAALSVYIPKFDNSVATNPLPDIYRPFLPSLSPIISSSHTTLLGIPSVPELTLSPSAKEKILRKQRTHLSSFYFKQVAARYINWCHTNDYANLIHPFLPDHTVYNDEYLSKSACRHILHRALLLVLNYTHDQLSSRHALPLLLSPPLAIYLNEFLSYTNSALHSLHQVALSKKGVSVEWEQKIFSKRLPKETTIILKKMPDGSVITDGELRGHDDVTDTILIGCKALVKVPYYLLRDPHKRYFQTPLEDGSYASPTNWTENNINLKQLGKGLDYCDKVIPSIFSSYNLREDRKQFKRLYESNEREVFHGHSVSPRFPLDLSTLRSQSQLTDAEKRVCSQESETGYKSNRNLLYCLNGLAKKLSLLLGTIATNSYLLPTNYTREVIPVLERLQVLQLVTIFVKEKENETHQEDRQGSNVVLNGIAFKIEEGTEHRANQDVEESLLLFNIIEDIVTKITTFGTEIRDVYTQGLEKLIDRPNLENIMKSCREEKVDFYIQNLPLEEFYGYMQDMRDRDSERKVRYAEKRHRQRRISKQENVAQQTKREEADVPDRKNEKLEMKEESNDSSFPLLKEMSNSELIKREVKEEEESSWEVKQEENIKEEYVESGESMDDTIVIEDTIEQDVERQKRNSTLTYFKYFDLIALNFIASLMKLPLFDLRNERKKTNSLEEINEEEPFQITGAQIIRIYEGIEALYQWSIPIAYFLHKNRPVFSSRLDGSLSSFSHAEFSFPGMSRVKEAMPWSLPLSNGLRRAVFNQRKWQKFFEGAKVQFPIATRTSHYSKAKTAGSKMDKEFSLANHGERNIQFKFKDFALSTFKGHRLTPRHSSDSSLSLHELFSQILPNFIMLMEFYQRIIVNGDLASSDELYRAMKEKDEKSHHSKSERPNFLKSGVTLPLWVHKQLIHKSKAISLSDLEKSYLPPANADCSSEIKIEDTQNDSTSFKEINPLLKVNPSTFDINNHTKTDYKRRPIPLFPNNQNTFLSKTEQPGQPHLEPLHIPPLNTLSIALPTPLQQSWIPFNSEYQAPVIPNHHLFQQHNLYPSALQSFPPPYVNFMKPKPNIIFPTMNNGSSPHPLSDQMNYSFSENTAASAPNQREYNLGIMNTQQQGKRAMPQDVPHELLLNPIMKRNFNLKRPNTLPDFPIHSQDQ